MRTSLWFIQRNSGLLIQAPTGPRAGRGPLFLAALVFGLLLSTAAHAKAEFKVYMTTQAKDGVPLNLPATDFSCNDTIYAVIEVSDLEKAKHELQATWRDPSGRDRERTQYPFWVHRDKERIWVWLKLHSSPEAALVRWANPSAGMDEFIGEWELDLLVDGKSIGKQSFKVLC